MARKRRKSSGKRCRNKKGHFISCARAGARKGRRKRKR